MIFESFPFSQKSENMNIRYSLPSILSLSFFLGMTGSPGAVVTPTPVVQFPILKKNPSSPNSDSLLKISDADRMPVFKPEPGIHYFILEMEVDPNIDYKILNVNNAKKPFDLKRYSPKFQNKIPIPNPPKIQQQFDPTPRGFQQKPKLPVKQ
jgi:hypothetical protein